jgi:hypothetical protein
MVETISVTPSPESKSACPEGTRRIRLTFLEIFQIANHIPYLALIQLPRRSLFRVKDPHFEDLVLLARRHEDQFVACEHRQSYSNQLIGEM